VEGDTLNSMKGSSGTSAQARVAQIAWQAAAANRTVITNCADHPVFITTSFHAGIDSRIRN
jgi:hypothetical protein